MQCEKSPQRTVGEGPEAEAGSSQGPRAMPQEVLEAAPFPQHRKGTPKEVCLWLVW